MQLIKTCNVILLAAVGNIDTSGISMLEEIKKIAERREQQVILSHIIF
jgi:sulfate transporter 3